MTVSIITPTFNRINSLLHVWKSIEKQTYKEWQWIVVDDGSTDETKSILLSVCDERLTYVYQKNSGVNSARNKGDSEVRGDYVVYLDSDDEFFSDESLGTMVNEIENTDDDVGAVSFTVHTSNGAKDSYIERDRMIATYLDQVCEESVWGEFISIYKKNTIKISPWPDYNGMEVIRHWRVAKMYNTLMIDKPARIYNKGKNDSLSSTKSLIERSASLAIASEILIDEHTAVWIENNKYQLGKYRFYQAMYNSLEGNGKNAIRNLYLAIYYGEYKVRVKCIVLAVGLLFPLEIRKKLFRLRGGYD